MAERKFDFDHAYANLDFAPLGKPRSVELWIEPADEDDEVGMVNISPEHARLLGHHLVKLADTYDFFYRPADAPGMEIDEWLASRSHEAALDAARREAREEAAIVAASHSMYPIETDWDRGYDCGRREAANRIRALSHPEETSDE